MKKYFNLENLALIIVFALPSYLLRFDVFGIPTNLLECLMLFFLALFFWSSENREKAKNIILENKPLFFFSGLLFLGLFVAAVGNSNLAGNIGIIKGWFILPFLFALAARSVFGESGCERLAKSLYWSASFVAVVSLAYLFLGKTTYDGRLESIFNSPNYLAMYLSPAIIIGFLMAGKLSRWGNLGRFSLGKVFFSLSFATIATAIYQTFSYASWMALAASIAVAVFMTKRIAKSRLIAGISVFLLIIILQSHADKFKSLVMFNERSSLASRIMIWKASFRIIADKWMFGIGPGNFQEYYLAYQKYFPPYLEWAVPHPHNLFLYIWLSSGVSGLIGFLGVIFFWAKKAFGRLRKNKSIAVFVAMISYILLVGILDTYMKNDLAVIFWLAIFSGVIR